MRQQRDWRTHSEVCSTRTLGTKCNCPKKYYDMGRRAEREGILRWIDEEADEEIYYYTALIDMMDIEEANETPPKKRSKKLN